MKKDVAIISIKRYDSLLLLESNVNQDMVTVKEYGIVDNVIAKIGD